ncbi:MAG: hypothetical protein TR69_WS6001001299 [candidate division WS6 bacterium OLB20]|uniref:Uncharacterized protein n=1 Tax=candidate division WS6 bacterium OLB20 TaxID=1617426 RepID=A0A136LWM0_9BACT|nr:MAG: hypothetical protein TR69_WS6001001299 [candidate division WS6 bacterium OLB20]
MHRIRKSARNLSVLAFEPERGVCALTGRRSRTLITASAVMIAVITVIYALSELNVAAESIGVPVAALYGATVAVVNTGS